MRTNVLPWMVLSALVLPSCTLVLNPERRWTGGDAPDAAMDAPVPDAPGLDAPAPDAPRDAAFPADASRAPNPTARTLSLTCPGVGQVTYADPSTGAQGTSALDAAFAAFGGWGGFAMLGNNVEIASAATRNAIPSHAIWLDPGPTPRVTWLLPAGEGIFEVGWDDPPGSRSNTLTTHPDFDPAPFVLANATRYMVGGGTNLEVCANTPTGGGCTSWTTGSEEKWGGFASGGRTLQVLRNAPEQVRFPSSTTPSMDFQNPSGQRLLQPTGTDPSALYSNDFLFAFGAGEPYSVNRVALPSPVRTRVGYDGSSYQAASISEEFEVTVSPCTAAGCTAGAAVTIDLPTAEQLTDWNFHALSEGNVRVAVLLTRIASGRGTHVWVAVWPSGATGTVTPLRIASGRGLESVYGEGRSIESVAQFNGTQLDVYVSALVALFSGSDTSLGDRIYLSGFRVCI